MRRLGLAEGVSSLFDLSSSHTIPSNLRDCVCSPLLPMDSNYDEFGNYIGPELVDSEDESVDNE